MVEGCGGGECIVMICCVVCVLLVGMLCFGVVIVGIVDVRSCVGWIVVVCVVGCVGYVE